MMTSSREPDISLESAKALSTRGYELGGNGDIEAAGDLLLQSLGIRRTLGDRSRDTALVLGNLSLIALERGDADQARSLAEESWELIEALESQSDMMVARYILGRIAIAQGDFAAAHTFLVERLRLCLRLEARQAVPITLAACAQLSRLCGKACEGAVLIGACEALMRALGADALEGRELADHERNVATLRSQLGDAAFAAACDQGRGLTYEEAIAMVTDAPSA